MVTITELEEKLRRGYELTVTNTNGEIDSILSFKEHEYIKAPCEKIETNHIINNFAQLKEKLLEPMTECKVSYDFNEKQYKSELLKNPDNLKACESKDKEVLMSFLGNGILDSLIILDSKINFENVLNKRSK